MSDCKCGTGEKAHENVCECGRKPPPKLREHIPEVKRKLASIRKIDAIEPIEGKDRIVLAKIGGWSLITQKDNGFEPGDLVVYFEIDSFLPVWPEFEFLRQKCFKSTKNLGDGFRIKTMKMAGVVSQGLILPLRILNGPNWDSLVELKEDIDLTEILGVQKYEKPIPTHLQGRVRGNFPSFIRKTDQERAQNLTKWLPQYLDTVFEVTTKLDGSSMTVYVSNVLGETVTTGVCSRNLDLAEDDENSFWKVAKELKLPERLLNFHAETGRNIAIQGELIGPGVQGNREKLDKLQFFVFDVWDIDKQQYLGPTDREELLDHAFPDLSRAPVVKVGIFRDMLMDTNNIVQDLLLWADNVPSINHEIAEGLVFKSDDGSFSFKTIANRFLLSGSE